MATRKSLTFAAVAVLLLAGLAGLGVWWLTREAAPAPPPPVAALPAPLPEPVPAPVAAPMVPPDPGPPGVVPRPTAADPKPVRTTNLANMGVGRFTGVPSDVFGALRPLGQRVARCVNPTPPAVAGPPHTVTLTMKTLDGKIRIVGALAPRGTPDHEEVTRCARAELVGQEVDSVDAVAGRTYKMPYPLPR